MPHDKTRDSSFLTTKTLVKFQWGHSQQGRQIQVGRSEFAIFNQYMSETVEDTDIAFTTES